MNSLLLFYGSKKAFLKKIPDYYKTLTDIVYEFDKDEKIFKVLIPGQNDELVTDKEKVEIENLVIFSDEYSGVREHVITNFTNFLSKFCVKNMYIQNPPVQISNQLSRLYPEGKIEHQKYPKITKHILMKIGETFDDVILGQKRAKNEIIQALYPLTFKSRKKPVVMMFYGGSGLGKTETAKLIANASRMAIFRKQFSMFQNNQFATYLFGGAHYEKSFAKDLLDRESNIILLDEFDKAHPSFHSAFYQIFDEGIFEDQNYSLPLYYSVIICTSNYKSIDEMKENLGEALFSRFDKVIKFEEIDRESKKRIAEICFEQNEKIFKIKIDDIIKNRLLEAIDGCDNVREIKRIIMDAYSYIALKKL